MAIDKILFVISTTNPIQGFYELSWLRGNELGWVAAMHNKLAKEDYLR